MNTLIVAQRYSSEETEEQLYKPDQVLGFQERKRELDALDRVLEESTPKKGGADHGPGAMQSNNQTQVS